MGSTRFVLKVKNGYEKACVAIVKLFLRDPFGNDVRIVVDADDWVATVKFSKKFVPARLIHTDHPAVLFAGNLGFPDEGLNEITDIATFGDEKIVVVLVAEQNPLARSPREIGPKAIAIASYLFRDSFGKVGQLDVLLRVELR